MRLSDLSFIFATILILHVADLFASEMEVDRISDRIIVINDGYFRVVAINTSEGIVLIDAHVSEEKMETCKELIKQTFNTNKIKYVIYTHGDLEHVLGYPVLINSTHIAHLGMRIRIKRNAETLHYIDSILPERETELARTDTTAKNFPPLLDEVNSLRWRKQALQTAMNLSPDIEFADRMTLQFDTLTVEIIYYGMGHGYSNFIYVPEERFLHSSTASTILPVPFWFLEYNTAFVDVDGSLDVLSQFVHQQDTLNRIVPCHGPYLKNKELQELYDYHKVIYETVKTGFGEGKTLGLIQEELAIPKAFADYDFAQKTNEDDLEKHKLNIEWMWKYIEETK